MTRYFLTRVRIEGFRGINNENQPLELKFKPEAVNSVFAVNATGKSSIFEALCYAIRGNVPKLRELQASERPDNYIANLFHSTGVATVELDLVDGQGALTMITVVRSPDGTRSATSVPASADPEAILKALDEDFTLIDYEQFTRFIDSTPLNRGRSFSALLGLSGYSQLRQLLQTLSDTRGFNTDFDLPVLETTISDNEGFAKESFSQFASAYTDLTGNSPGDVTDVAKWGGDILAALTSIELLRASIGSMRLSEIDFVKLRELVRGEEGGTKRDELGRLIELTTRLRALEAAPDEFAEADAVVLRGAVARHAELLALTAGSDYQHLHDAALRLYRSGRWQDSRRCALCQTELTASLEPHLIAEVAKYDAVRAQEQSMRSHVESSAWLASLRALEGVPELAVTRTEQRADTLMDHAQRGVLTNADVDEAHDFFRVLCNRLAAVLAECKQQREALEKELPPSLVAVTTQIEHGARARDSLSAYWRSISTLVQTRAKLAKYERWQKFIKDVSDEISGAEASLTVERLDALGNDYKVLFQEVMGVKDVVPALARSDQNENLDVQLEEFHGLASGLSARALLSESYRNALAVSVFLSAAGRQRNSARFIVLDDVTSSFDAGHQFRLMEQIRQRLQYRGGDDGLQFIVFSHDGLLQKYFDKVAQEGGWHHQRLQGLPPLGAVTVVGQDAQRLRSIAAGFLSAGQVNAAEPLLRQYLELSLLQVIDRVRIPVPIDISIRDDRQMVQNMLDAILAAIRLHQKGGDLILMQTQVDDLNKRHVTSLISNWVSHYSTGSTSSLSPAVLLGVLDTIDELVDCFKWDDTSTTPPRRLWYKNLSRRS